MEARNSKKLKPKSASFSEPRFGGQRTLTQPFVSVRCPPKRGSENEAVFGFRKGFQKRIFFQLQSLAKSLNFNHFVQMQFAVSKHISAPLPPALQIDIIMLLIRNRHTRRTAAETTSSFSQTTRGPAGLRSKLLCLRALIRNSGEMPPLSRHSTP